MKHVLAIKKVIDNEREYFINWGMPLHKKNLGRHRTKPSRNELKVHA